MARNVEIKARIPSAESLLPKVAAVADSGPTEIRQDDTFFPCPNGRLKLRAFSPSGGELIFYKRPDVAGPKESAYTIVPTSEPELLREVLAAGYGSAGWVRKHRTLFLAGRTRIHLDRVEGLGDFLELEVVLKDGESADTGMLEANRLLEALGISQEQMISRAYVDLLQNDPAGADSLPRLPTGAGTQAPPQIRSK